MITRSVRRARLSAVAVVCLSLSACATDRTSVGGTLDESPLRPELVRNIASAAWDTLWVRRGADHQRLGWTHPYFVRATAKRVYVFDVDQEVLFALSRDGRPLWKAGHSGKDSTGFSNVRDFRIDSTETVFLLDPPNRRIAIVDSMGRVAQPHAVSPASGAEQMVMTGPREFALFNLMADSALTYVSLDTPTLRRERIPWRTLNQQPGLARQGSLVAAPDGARWAFVSMLGDGWVRYSGSTAQAPVLRYVQHRAFPQVRVQSMGKRSSMRFAAYSPCTGCDASIDGNELLILAGGSAESSRQLVDVYDWSSGEYQRSYRLPERSERIAVRDGIYYVVSSDDAGPVVMALRPRRQS